MRNEIRTPGGALRRAIVAALVALAAVAGPRDARAGEGEGCAGPPPPGDCAPYPCCTCNEAKEPTCPPKYANRRFVENWRPCLCKDPCAYGDLGDFLQARPISRGGTVWASVGGQLRLRWESFTNQGFGAPADPDDAWLLGRARAHLDLHVGDHLRVFVEGIYANQWDQRELGPRPIDRNLGDLLNLFAEGRTDAGSIGQVGAWVGRHELETGKQRLVSPLDWANTRRTFDGVGAWWKRGFHALEAWWTQPVVVEPTSLDERDEDRTFWGVDYTNTTLSCLTWEAYLLGLHDDETTARPDQDRYTIGARIDGKIPTTRFDYDAEAAYQLGTLADLDISAFMVSATLGWKPCWCGKPAFGVGFDYATGDSDPTDGDAGTFNQLYPLGHKYLGHADLIGRQNVVAARLEASVQPLDRLTLSAWYHLFWRADSADAAYNAAGGVLRAPGGSSDLFVGSELDVMLEYAIDRHWTAFAEWCHFFPGAFIEATGPSEDVDVWYLGVQCTF